jgi:hypothetical protein
MKKIDSLLPLNTPVPEEIFGRVGGYGCAKEHPI